MTHVRKQFVCQHCKFIDQKPPEEIFKTLEPEEMRIHWQEAHDYSEQSKLKKKDDTIKPVSYELMRLRSSVEPMRFRLAQEEDGFKFIQVVNLPAYEIEAPNKKDLTTEFVTDFVYRKDIMRLSIEISPLDRANYSFFSLPIGYHTACMECPNIFDKQILNMVQLASTGKQQLRTTFGGHELDIILFRCFLSLCPGVKEKYKEKLLAWTSWEVEVEDSDEKETHWIWKFYEE